MRKLKLVHVGPGEQEYPTLRCTRCGWHIQQIDIPPVVHDPATFVCLKCQFPDVTGGDAA